MIKATHRIHRFAVFLCGLVLSGSALAAGGHEGLEAANAQVGNRAMLQRGAAMYMNYCAGCHSMKYLRYSRMASDLGLSEEQMMANLVPPGGKFGDTMTTGMAARDGTTFFGKAPPDLSLVARSRGVDWIYSYLKSFYVDPSAAVGWNNTVYPNASMPHVLAELQGIQVARHDQAHAEGEAAHAPTLELSQPGRLTTAQYNAALRDLVSFMQYAGEPAVLKRQAMGVWVLLYLAMFTLIAWCLKREFWKDVH